MFRSRSTRFLLRLTPAGIPLPPHHGHEGGPGHPPPPRPIRLSSLLRAEIHDHNGPARKEPCVSIIPDMALCCKAAFNPDSLKDDELAGRLGLQLKELTKLVTVLDKAGLVKTYVPPVARPLDTPYSPYADTARTSSKRARSVRSVDSTTTSTTSTFVMSSSGGWRKCEGSSIPAYETCVLPGFPSFAPSCAKNVG